MHVEEPLSGSSRFEPLHLALSSPHRLMRILGTIVRPEPLLMTGLASTLVVEFSGGSAVSDGSVVAVAIGPVG